MRMQTSGPAAVVGFGPELFRRPSSVFFWGDDRTALNQLAFHAARAADPEFLWIDVRASTDPRSAGDPGASKVLPTDRVVEIRPERLRPRLGAGSGLLARVAALDPGSGLLRDLLPVLHLPNVISSLVGRMAPSEGPRVLAVANTDRIAEFYPADRLVVRGFVRALGRLGISLVVSYAGPPRKDFAAWEHLFHLTTEAGPGGASSALRCERGPPEAWRLGTPYPFDEIDGLRGTINELETSSTRSPPLAFIPALTQGDGPEEGPTSP